MMKTMTVFCEKQGPGFICSAENVGDYVRVIDWWKMENLSKNTKRSGAKNGNQDQIRAFTKPNMSVRTRSSHACAVQSSARNKIRAQIACAACKHRTTSQAVYFAMTVSFDKVCG